MESWKQIQETVQKSVCASAYSTWIAPLGFDKIDLDTIYIVSPTCFIADWVKRNFFSSILSAVQTVYPNVKDIVISVAVQTTNVSVIKSEIQKGEQQILSLETPDTAFNIASKVSQKYTFENFVQGSSNNLALASVKRLIEDEGVVFNPLFIHSPSGFGKTHLLNAFVNEMAVQKSLKKIVYLSADKFMYSFVKALRENDTYRFKQSFKNADVLVIDDFHFIVGKEATAKELFHIIEDYITGGKQVILASNASPFVMEGLNENLRSRVSAGLVVDILSADFNLRAEIVKVKSKALDLELADGISEFIASKISSSIREIEGALNRISAHTILMNETPVLSNIRKILADILAVNSKPLSIEDIKKVVADKWGVSITDMDSERKQREIVIPRQVAMYIAKSLTSQSLPSIGKTFGGRDHATVIYAVKKVKELMVANPRMESLINEVEKICSTL